mmetsp:Transcript_3875/g.13428  ORF Transcript_3875/g.13428 Transcript_3875/m.13428 type:complete len:232 (+) Transcript_3875:263-958(+)
MSSRAAVPVRGHARGRRSGAGEGREDDAGGRRRKRNVRVRFRAQRARGRPAARARAQRPRAPAQRRGPSRDGHRAAMLIARAGGGEKRRARGRYFSGRLSRRARTAVGRQPPRRRAARRLPRKALRRAAHDGGEPAVQTRVRGPRRGRHHLRDGDGVQRPQGRPRRVGAVAAAPVGETLRRAGVRRLAGPPRALRRAPRRRARLRLRGRQHGVPDRRRVRERRGEFAVERR